jgi:hypothetical protein
MPIYFLETFLDCLTAHYIRECRILLDVLQETSLKTFIKMSGKFFVRELAEKDVHYEFRVYLHNNLSRPIVQPQNKEGKGVTNRC